LLLALFLLLLSYDIFRDINDKVIFYSFLFTLMSFYIILWSYTDQGIKNVKESPKRVNIFKSKIENAGGKLIETYYTFGKYDGVSIVEAPNDEALMSCLLSIGSQGNARTVTLKAFTYEDASKIMENIQQ
jgi:uncharacterized protein with GYD domain